MRPRSDVWARLNGLRVTDPEPTGEMIGIPDMDGHEHKDRAIHEREARITQLEEVLENDWGRLECAQKYNDLQNTMFIQVAGIASPARVEAAKEELEWVLDGEVDHPLDATRRAEAIARELLWMSSDIRHGNIDLPDHVDPEELSEHLFTLWREDVSEIPQHIYGNTEL